eukprot:6906905-Prymnesium_polylepis.1
MMHDDPQDEQRANAVDGVDARHDVVVPPRPGPQKGIRLANVAIIGIRAFLRSIIFCTKPFIGARRL